MRAPEITNAQLIYNNCYVYSDSNVLFIVPADSIMGWTAKSITVKLGKYYLTYSNIGTQQSIQTVY